MAMKCENCGKGIMYGHNVSHSKRRTRRIFKPNLHLVKISFGTVKKRMKLCTKCLRKLKNQKAKVKSEIKDEKIQQFNNQTIQPLATSN